MTSITIHENNIILPKEIFNTMIGKTYIPILTDDGVLLKTTRNDAVTRSRGILTRPESSVDSFLERKRSDKEVER